MHLLERDHQLRCLRRAWDDALAGSGSIVLLAGESGIGKTQLARVFVDGLDDGQVLWGMCDPLGVPRPLGPLHDVAADLGDSLARLLADGAPLHEISGEVLRLLKSGPVLLVVDDLQWADEATVDLLRFLLRRISGTRSLVLATYRADDLDHQHALRWLLGDVARTPAATRLDLAPLSVEAVTTMVGARDIDPAHLHRLTRGNSFFVTEIVSQDGEVLPTTVRDAVLARATGLDAAARDLAELVACAPTGIPDVLLPALGVGSGPLRALDDSGLVARDRRGITYRHDICRLAVADAIPPGGEVALHRRMLAAFETQSHPDPAVLVHHAIAAGDDERVFSYADRAGRAAAGSGAHTEAVRFFRTALDAAPSATPGARAELAELLAVELYLTDRLGEAIAAGRRAVSLRQTEGDLGGVSAGRRLLAVLEWYLGDRRRAEEHAAAAVDVLEARPDPAPRESAALGHAYSIQAFLAMQMSDLVSARERCARAREVAEGVGDRAFEIRLGVIESVVAVMSGDDGARDRLLDVLEQARDRFDEEARSTVSSSLVELDVEQRRLDDAEEILAHSLPLTAERDVRIAHGLQLGVRARLHLLRGAWDDASRDASTVLAGSRSAVTHTWPCLVRGLVALRSGRAGAGEHLERGWELAQRFGEPLRLLPAAAALAERCWTTGTADTRLDHATTLLSAASLPGTEWSAGDLAVWLVRLGREVDTSSLRVAPPFRLLLDGRSSAAAACWEALGCPYEQALAMVDSGELAAIFAALEILDHLGADAIAARVRRNLRRRGVTRIPARPRTSTRANPAGLTSRQVDVVRLLAEGLTNAEIAARLVISEKTADHHVSAILTKLDVRTRREAAAAARVLGVVQERRHASRDEATEAPLTPRP
ncbi:ATP-binding protein [Actinomycetospora chibensis]|uniref:AAA family ATPase n=1 Tax=Actinomycetospora chibensis TaxID=663606 RepID=A0ABV9RQL7_9PSEU|nr:LuxR family transcriptional regulator [Actinomycetospora chibensis]MDD7927260.1 AAA family ATPase [Actinomycetospora chibensis]